MFNALDTMLKAKGICKLLCQHVLAPISDVSWQQNTMGHNSNNIRNTVHLSPHHNNPLVDGPERL
jgi:hypothetical protein